MRAEQTAGRADGIFEKINSEKKRAEQSRAGPIRADQTIATFIFHWKLFPLCDTVRLKYQSKNNNINLCVFNIFYE